MSKTLFTIILPPAKVRKTFAPGVRIVKDKKKYCRKRKHKEF